MSCESLKETHVYFLVAFPSSSSSSGQSPWYSHASHRLNSLQRLFELSFWPTLRTNLRLLAHSWTDPKVYVSACNVMNFATSRGCKWSFIRPLALKCLLQPCSVWFKVDDLVVSSCFTGAVDILWADHSFTLAFGCVCLWYYFVIKPDPIDTEVFWHWK